MSDVEWISKGKINLSRLVKYLSTWNGTDNVLELLQNIVKLLIPLLHLKARLQHRAGLIKSDQSSVAVRLGRLGPLISDSRMLFRFWGSLPILQWLLSLSKYPRATQELTTIERLQCLAMLTYYPLEHLFYLRVHDIIPPVISLPFILKPTLLNPRRLVMWSCRFFTVYLLLQFVHINEDRKLLLKKEKALSRANEKDEVVEVERRELRERWAALRLAVISTACKLPTGLHWALESGFFPNDVVGDLVAFTASVITFRTGWKSTAAPSSIPPSVKKLDVDVESVDGSSTAKVSTDI